MLFDSKKKRITFKSLKVTIVKIFTITINAFILSSDKLFAFFLKTKALQVIFLS